MNTLSHKHELFSDSGCLSQEALERYLGHLLTDDELKIVDEHLSSCPLCSDAVEGLSEKSASYSPGIASHSRQINNRLRRRFNYDPSRRHSSRKGPALGNLLIPAAASIIILLGIIGYFHYFFPEAQDIALAETEILPVQGEERTIAMEKEEVPHTTQTDHPPVGGIPEKSEEDVAVIDKVSVGAGSAAPDIRSTEVQVIDHDVPVNEIIPVEVNDDVTLAKSDVLEENQEVYADEEMVVAEEMVAPSAGVKSKAMREQKKSSQEVVFTVVEQMPEFPGGEDSLNIFLMRNIRYPRNDSIYLQGTVYAQFTITKKGKIRNVTILRGIGEDYDQEVIRVLKMMPDWIPGKQRGEPVSVIINIPVHFKLQ